MTTLEDYIKLDGKTCDDCIHVYDKEDMICIKCLRNPAFKDEFVLDMDIYLEKLK